MNAPVRQRPEQAVTDARKFVAGFMARGQEPCDVILVLGARFALPETTWGEALKAATMKARHIGPCVMVER